MKEINLVPQTQSTIFYSQVDGSVQEVLKLCGNGDIFVKGKLIKLTF